MAHSLIPSKAIRYTIRPGILQSLVFGMQEMKSFPVHALFLAPAFAMLVVLKDALAQLVLGLDYLIKFAAFLAVIDQTRTLAADEILVGGIEHLAAPATVQARTQKVIPLATIPAGGGRQGYR